MSETVTIAMTDCNTTTLAVEARFAKGEALARTSGVNRVQVVDIAAHRNSGSVRTLRMLADALAFTVDDLIPTADHAEGIRS